MSDLWPCCAVGQSHWNFTPWGQCKENGENADVGFKKE